MRGKGQDKSSEKGRGGPVVAAPQHARGNALPPGTRFSLPALRPCMIGGSRCSDTTVEHTIPMYDQSTPC